MTRSRYLDQEYRISQGEKPFPPVTLVERAYLARILEHNGRLAEALISMDRSTERSQEAILQSVKTQIFCGDLKAASVTAMGLLHELPATSALRCEVELELARICYSLGQWPEAIAWTERALSHNPPRISELTLWQVAAAARQEVGDFLGALALIQKIESLKDFFPSGNVLFYARNQKVKLLLRLGEEQKARELLDVLWETHLVLGQGQLSLDALLTLARTELDFASFFKSDGTSWARIGLIAAHLIGDELFFCLLLAEHAVNQKHLNKMIDVDYRQALSAARIQFHRVDAYLKIKEIELPDQKTKYVAWFGSMLPRLCPLESTHIVLMEKGFLIHIENRSVVRFDPRSATGKLFRLLARGIHSSEKLFNDIYDLPFTVKRSGTLRAFLSRARKVTGLELKQDGDQILVEEKIVFQDGTGSL